MNGVYVISGLALGVSLWTWLLVKISDATHTRNED